MLATLVAALVLMPPLPSVAAPPALRAPALALMPAPPVPPAPASAPTAEVDSPAMGLERHPHWALRAIACMGLESIPGAAATAMLHALARDDDARVRAFAVAALSLRSAAPAAESLLADPDPRVLRSALRCGAEVDPAKLAERAGALLRSQDPQQILTGVELAAFVDEPRLRSRAVEELGRIILRLDRVKAGELASRLEAVTGERAGVRPREWQRWWQSTHPARRTLARTTVEPGQPIAAALPGDFRAFAIELARLVQRPIELAVCIDSTASMSRDLATAQSSADAAARLIHDLVPQSRMGLVAYRDRRSDFVVRHWPLTEDLAAWRTALWELIADKGGSAPESVDEGLRATYDLLGWTAGRRGMVVLMGDGPPHAGTRGHCAAMAAAARERLGVVTFTVGATEEREVKGFAEISSAGGGQSLRLAAAPSLPPLMLGGSFGDQWAPLIRAFLDRCDLLIR